MAIPVIGLLAAIAIPSLVKARSVTQEKVCINNIRLIEHAKEQLVLERAANPGDALPVADVKALLGPSQSDSGSLFCPRDPQKSFETSYRVGAVGEDPVCVFHASGPTAHSHPHPPTSARPPPAAREPGR